MVPFEVTSTDSDKDNEEVIEPAIQITLDATDTDVGDE